ncbi:DUF2145 domain-containing protein [Alteromonas aestuariivivens]|uniref:DUF2145 domain-containing protein n=1 Tax=Alteromonas aestuariivivens TaxID=1938339 RepID=A0A3D8MCJ7_9ALTE|nr:DUF2145 domain-containing protein [Alteromonas aestuariivivens]RDV28228.1 DUF2145 domain-containing protein [Alteromonas aestuariivivens]
MQKLRFVVFVLLVSVTGVSFAGSEQPREAIYTPERIAGFSKQVERYLAEQGAYAVLLGRMGRSASEMPEGIRFTHTAIALYSTIKLDDGRTAKGYAIHNLYQESGAPGKSKLVTDYPVDFFWSAQALEAGIVIPSREIQARLLALYASDTPVKLHNPDYSVIANPNDLRFQNCTEYTLDLLNAAIYDTNDRERLKRNTRAYFHAQPVKISRIKLALGSWLDDSVTTRDHDGKVETATLTTLARYLETFGLLDKAVIVSEQGQVSNLLPI